MASLSQPAIPSPSEADVVTQLQECLDQLATRFYASLRYVTIHHPVSPPPGTVSAPAAASQAAEANSPPHANATISSSHANANVSSSQANAITSSSQANANVLSSQANTTNVPPSSTGPIASQASHVSNSFPSSNPAASPAIAASANAPSPSGGGGGTVASTAGAGGNEVAIGGVGGVAGGEGVGGERGERGAVGGQGDALAAAVPYSPTHAPLAEGPGGFADSTRELAQDLVLKTRQIEALVATLPVDLDAAQAAQDVRIRELERDLAALATQRQQWRGEKRELLRKTDRVVSSFRRVI